MKETWYGDKRDLLKWSVVLELSRQHQISTVFHLAMMTRSAGHHFTIDGKRFPVSDPVWDHFRSLRNVERLFGAPKLHIFYDDFTLLNRRDYFEKAISEMKALQGPKLVLLDPDTGLAPQRATERHISTGECQVIWNALESGDLLLLYQHSWRSREWREQAAEQFQSGLKCGQLIQAEAKDFASDVVFLGARKQIGE